MRAKLRYWLRSLVFDAPLHIPLLVMSLSVLFLVYYLVSNSIKPPEQFYRSELVPPTSVSFASLAKAVTEGG